MVYRMLAGPGEAELLIKKSRFIGRARPIDAEDEAQIYLASLRREYWDASHHCYAYVLGRHDEVQRSSDAGEPAGTAGRPILETIKKEALKNTIVQTVEKGSPGQPWLTRTLASTMLCVRESQGCGGYAR